jgi:hypothetical protein
VLVVLSGLLLLAGVAAAVPAEEAYSPYEQETLDMVLAERGGELDLAAEGKIIEAIDIQVLDVIEDRDPLIPNFLNAFHANSRPEVVRGRMLLKKGRRYEAALASETERNLRGLRQVSLVIIAPLVGSKPDRVRLLVIVKDTWSLRLNNNIVFKKGQLELLLLQLAEENLAGTHRKALGTFVYEPDTLTFGLRGEDPRIDYGRYFGALDNNIIVNHHTGEVEGTAGTFIYGEQRETVRQTWSWGAQLDWLSETSRDFSGTLQNCFRGSGAGGLRFAPCDPVAVQGGGELPIVYDSEVLTGAYGLTRSFGIFVNHDVTVGMQASRSVYRAEPGLAQLDFAPGSLNDYDAELRDEYIDTVLPRSQTRIGPYFQYRLHVNDFHSVLNIESLGLQENYRLGPEFYFRFTPLTKALASTRDVMVFHSTLAYTAPLGDGMVRPYGASKIEAEIDPNRVSDVRVQTGLRAASPRLKIGRLIYDGTLVHRPRNFLNGISALGGSGRLRGYPSGFFVGKDMLASNVEFRTRPLQLGTFQFGGVLFYDVGDAFEGFDELQPKQGAGFGVRALMPQIGRSVLAVDWGFALTPSVPRTSIFEGLIVTFRQAFDTPRPGATSVQLTQR